MASNYQKRLERLQEALASRLNKPLASRFLAFDPDATAADYEVVKEQEIDKLVDAGEILPNQRNRVLAFRWMTSEENADLAQQQLDGPVPDLARHSTSPDPALDPVPAGETEDERSARFNRPLDHQDLGIV